MFIAAFSTTAREQKQPKCPLVKKSVKKMCVYIHIYTHTNTIEQYSVIKQNEILPFVATWVDREGIMLSEMSDIERCKSRNLTYIQNLKY